MHIDKLLLGFMTIPFLYSFKCDSRDGSTQVETDAVKIKHDNKKADVPKWEAEAEIPAHSSAGEGTVTSPDGEEFTFKHKGNDGEGPLKIKVKYYDPLVLQVPAGWTISAFTYTTAAGSGNATLSTGPIPSSFGGGPSGPFTADDYVAEAGYQLVLVTIPEAHQVPGLVVVNYEVSCPLGSESIDTIKAISTVTLECTDYFGNTVVCYPPNDVDTSFDFVDHNDGSMTAHFDFTAPSCTGPAGNRPSFDIAAGSDWFIGTTATVVATGLDPLLPSAYIMGSSNFIFPGIPYGGLGCRLHAFPDISAGLAVSPDGTATYSVPINGDPNLIGLVLNWQCSQPSGSNLVIGDVLRCRIEP